MPAPTAPHLLLHSISSDEAIFLHGWWLASQDVCMGNPCRGRKSCCKVSQWLSLCSACGAPASGCGVFRLGLVPHWVDVGGGDSGQMPA